MSKDVVVMFHPFSMCLLFFLMYSKVIYLVSSDITAKKSFISKRRSFNLTNQKRLLLF